MNIVNMSAPFDPFPEFLRKEYDILRFAYEWRFSEGYASQRVHVGQSTRAEAPADGSRDLSDRPAADRDAGDADPNFRQTVTYICEHSEHGALGLVINRPLDIDLGSIFEQLSMTNSDP